MTQDEFKSTLSRIGLSNHECAECLGISPRTVSKYIYGERGVPPTIAKVMNLMLVRPEMVGLMKEMET